MDGKNDYDLLFYLGNHYKNTYNKLMKAELSENGFIVEHELQNISTHHEMKDVLTNISAWISLEKQYNDYYVSKIELELPLLHAYISKKKE